MTDQNNNPPINTIDINAPFEVKVNTNQGSQIHRLKYPNEGQIELFERKRKGTLEQSTKGGAGKLDNPVISAHLWFYNLLAFEVEGMSADFKEKVSPMIKHAVAEMLWKNNVLNENQVIEIYGQEYIINPDKGQVIYLQVFHNKKWTLTRHILGCPSENMYIAFKSLGGIETTRKKNKVLLSTADTAKERIRMYDELFIDSEGYSSKEKSAIPGTHKIEVLEHIFRVSTDEIIEIEGN